MVIVLMLASLVGGFATLVVLSPYGWLTALACAPLGGSGLTLIVVLVAALVRGDEPSGAPLPAPGANGAALSR